MRCPNVLLALASVAVLAAGGCTAPGPPAETETPAAGAERPRYALAIHGGAGTLSPSALEGEKQAYLDSLRNALELGRSILDAGGTALDTVEQVIVVMEDDPRFNAGRGAVFNHDGGHELDASIMSGKDRSCGAVAGVTTVKNPIVLARLVMERSEHVLLAGAGAERFADRAGVERVSPEYFATPKRREQWNRRLRKDTGAGEPVGTVGVVALDRSGDLAAGTSTGGLTGKRFGRIGDSPVVGAGTYADNRTCAVSCTGKGEEFIRHGVARSVAALMEYRGATLREAADEIVHRVLSPGDGGLIAVGRGGEIALAFNTGGMFRGAADSTGRFEVAIRD